MKSIETASNTFRKNYKYDKQCQQQKVLKQILRVNNYFIIKKVI